jgi:hypothetical protein
MPTHIFQYVYFEEFVVFYYWYRWSSCKILEFECHSPLRKFTGHQLTESTSSKISLQTSQNLCLLRFSTFKIPLQAYYATHQLRKLSQRLSWLSLCSD